MKKRGRPKGTKKGKGIMGSLLKAVAPPIIDAAAGAVKGKVSLQLKIPDSTSFQLVHDLRRCPVRS